MKMFLNSDWRIATQLKWNTKAKFNFKDFPWRKEYLKPTNKGKGYKVMLFRETFCNGKVSLSRLHLDATGKITQTKRIGLKA